VSLLMVAVVVLFAPALLGLVLLASRLEARVLGTPGNRPVRARKAPAAVPATADRPTRDQVA
jgi:hypothetical protein